MMRIACVGLLWISATALAERPKKPVAPADPPMAQDPNQCSQATAEARWVGYGYTHSVTLRNGCQRAVACTLWTDVDPEPKQSVQVAPGESESVVTRRGSPSRELSAFKNCTFR
jgi:hypothetical protein